MSRYLLDTDTLSLMQYGHTVAIHNLSRHADADIALAALSFQEQMRGWLARLNKLKAPAQVSDWYNTLVIRLFPFWRRFKLLPVPVAAIARFDQLKSLRLNIGPIDMRVAAIALEESLIVVTRNTRDFGRVPGLQIEDWTV